MAPIVADYPTPVPYALLEPLKEHLPHSFSVLRRGQFSHFPQGTTPHAHFLIATHPSNSLDDSSPASPHFAAAYLDLSRHRETELFLYSPLQDHADPAAALSEADIESVLDLLVALFQRVRLLAQSAAETGAYSLFRAVPDGGLGGTMVGGLHEPTWKLLEARRGFRSSYWNPHDVWLFRVPELPEIEGDPLGPGMRWDVIKLEDVPLIASRTKIPKVAETLMSEPCVAVRDGEGALVAWGFMGVAGTLATLHVEVSFCPSVLTICMPRLATPIL